MSASGRSQSVPIPAQIEDGFVQSPPIVIPAKKVHEDATAGRAHATDAGIDLVATQDVEFINGQVKPVPTGIAVAIPEGYFGMLVPRSGISSKRGLMLINSVGVIDAGYRGELVCMFVATTNATSIKAGERVAQLVLVPTLLANLDFVDSLDETERGEGGFGSTGV